MNEYDVLVKNYLMFIVPHRRYDSVIMNLFIYLSIYACVSIYLCDIYLCI